MGNRGPALFCRMFELLVTAGLIDLEPAIAFQRSDYVPAVHSGSFLPMLYDTHFIHIDWTACQRESNQAFEVC